MTPKRLILILAVFATLVVCYNIFRIEPGLKNALTKLNETEKHLDDARHELESNHRKLDSIQLSLLKFNNYLIAIQVQTQILYNEKAIREESFKQKKDSLLREVRRLKEKIDTLEIPELKLYDSRPNPQ